MGITGSGKSSFIKALTGRADIVVGDGLESSEYLWVSSQCALLRRLTLCVAYSNRNRTALPRLL